MPMIEYLALLYISFMELSLALFMVCGSFDEVDRNSVTFKAFAVRCSENSRRGVAWAGEITTSLPDILADNYSISRNSLAILRCAQSITSHSLISLSHIYSSWTISTPD